MPRIHLLACRVGLSILIGAFALPLYADAPSPKAAASSVAGDAGDADTMKTRISRDGGHFPHQTGDRFSMNASIPSCASRLARLMTMTSAA